MKKIEVEGGEFMIQSKEGHYAIIPAKDRNKVMKLVEQGCDDCINEYIKGLPRDVDYAKDGLTVSALYEEKTGKPWSTAKKEGLTDGSYKKNIELREKLLSNNYEEPVKSTNNNTNLKSYNNARTFSEAFNIARQELGANNIFEYQGRKYGTNLKGEKFEPTKEVLVKANMYNPEVKERIKKENKLVESVFSEKETAKLEPEYKEWEDVKARRDEINKMEQAEIIKSYHKNSDEEYLIADKKTGKLHLMRGDKEIASYNIGVGANIGDEQTRTWVDKETKKVDWSKGNAQTGAGVYTVSSKQKENPTYYNAPSWNFTNEYGIEVPMAIHGASPDRVPKILDNDPSNNRVSNGCINGICKDIRELYDQGFGVGQKLYVLPDDDSNRFEIKNGKLVFSSSNPNVNRTVNTLNYKPIKLEINEEDFREHVFTYFDFTDEKEFETTKRFVSALQNNKQSIMKAAKINGDIYNDIAKIAFGIYGTESNYGDTHSAVGNFARAVRKVMSPQSSSSPDVVSKATTYGLTGENRSVGYTQIRWSQLNEREKSTLKELGINSNEDFLIPEKSAIATATILAIRYQEQLDKNQKQDIYNYLPRTWNNRENYSQRVNQNSRFLNIKELN